MDPITAADVKLPVGDGLPESLEEVIHRYGHRWFKLKVGGDIAQLVAGSACFFRAPVDDLERLDRETFEAYLAGIEAAGADVDSSEVRLACLVTTLCQWSAIVVGPKVRL